MFKIPKYNFLRIFFLLSIIFLFSINVSMAGSYGAGPYGSGKYGIGYVAPTTSSSGGSGSYIKETTKPKSNILKFELFILKGTTFVKSIEDDKGTGIKEFEIKAKDILKGEINFESLNLTPEYCSIKYEQPYKIYKVIDINHTFNNTNVEDVYLRLGVEQDWIIENNISKIKTIKCYPVYEDLKISYYNKTDEEDIYEVYSDGFSTWVVLGTSEKEHFIEKYWEIFLKIIITLLLILLIVVIVWTLYKKNLYEKIKRNVLGINLKDLPYR